MAIVRMSGRDARRIAAALFRPSTPGPLAPWQARHGTLLDADGGAELDEALALLFLAPRSYTGEDVVEFHCHGSPIVVDAVLRAALVLGARPAERGEFTRRAVLNGKMDLLQAEAVADLIEARASSGAAAAWQQLQGALSERLGRLRSGLARILAEIEAHVDFSDDELPEPAYDERSDAVRAASAEIGSMLDGFALARRHREGVHVVFCGRPNAGKSSLVNRLLGDDRMIVTDEAGTTRDCVDESLELAGLAVVLTDTAGLGPAAGRAESQAIERASRRIDDADLRVLVVDSTEAASDLDPELLRAASKPPAIAVLNKSDLAEVGEDDLKRRLTSVFAMVVSTSAVTGDGCDRLAQEIGARARTSVEATAAGVGRERHRSALERTRACLERALPWLEAEGSTELAAFELRAALSELASIAGEVDNEEVLDRIFAEFCIGK